MTQLCTVVFAVVLLTATALPRFGTLWHTHEGGQAAHTHQHLSTTPEVRTHNHPLVQHAHHHGASAPVSLSDAEDADLHWHDFADSLPVGTVDPLLFFLDLCAACLTTYRLISHRSRPLFFTSPRAPPVCSPSHS